MKKYISLLRGINVSGHKLIKMADLRGLYQDLGFENVVSYIQSGNVIFDAPAGSPASIRSAIQAAILQRYEFSVPVAIRTPDQLGKFIKQCPFGEIDLQADGTKYNLSFFTKKPSASAIKHLQEFVNPPEQIIVMGSEAYLHYPNGCARSKLTNKLIEGKLKVEATARNWKTVHRLYELSTT
jgi:uncharacterized protein (DUF1697 family)